MVDALPAEPDRVPSTWRAYRVIVGSRFRSQLAYPTSFVLDALNQLVFGLLELLELWVVYHNAPVLAGLDWRQALLVLALSRTAFSTSDLLVGHLDGVPEYLRRGTLEAFLVRPLPVLAQLVTGDISLRRLVRALFFAALLAFSLVWLGIDWTPSRVAVLAGALVGGVLVSCALFVTAGAVQFWLVDGGDGRAAVRGAVPVPGGDPRPRRRAAAVPGRGRPAEDRDRPWRAGPARRLLPAHPGPGPAGHLRPRDVPAGPAAAPAGGGRSGGAVPRLTAVVGRGYAAPVTDHAPPEDASAELDRLRASIDNLDAAVVHLLAERFKCTQQVGRLKARHGMPASDPGREAQQIERLHRLAADADLDPVFAERFLTFVIAEVIRHHRQQAEQAAG